MNHEAVAKTIAEALGPNNLLSAAHCATRLRLTLKNIDQADLQALDDCADIKGTFNANGLLQIIIGPGDVNVVYAKLIELTGTGAVSIAQANEQAFKLKKQNPLTALVKILSDIFVPLMPALVAGGLLMALNNVLVAKNLFGPLSLSQRFPGLTDFASIVNLLAVAPFAFMPVLIGMSAAERFGGNRYLGAAIGMAMVMPDLVNGYAVAQALADGTMPYWNIFGLQVMQAGYQGMVIPVIFVALIIAKIEKFLHKWIPRSFDFTFTPLISVIVTGFLTFILVGPIMRIASDTLTGGLAWLYETGGFIGAAIFGGFYAPLVITGLHQSFPAIEIALIADIFRTGGDFIFPVASISNIAQGAATLAVFFTTRDQKQKGLASSSSISALLGITEPAMFGVNLKLKFPFYCALIASALTCIFIGLFNVRSAALGSAGLIGFISIVPKSIPPFLMCCALSFAISFALTLLYAKKQLHQVATESNSLETTAAAAETKPAATAAETTATAAAKMQPASAAKAKGTLLAPFTGHSAPVSESTDPVFAGKVLGDGVIIMPEGNRAILVAPADGVILNVAETSHALALETIDGLEILIHIGVNTVKMKGNGFRPLVAEGAKVKAGEPLCEVDLSAILEAGYQTSTPIIIVNTDDLSSMNIETGTVTAGQSVVISYEKL
ncbi:MAG: sucrose-specific PTS transporter subunit IIBC [Deltaproteobacteria bacterium]|nr:sucrose-specific PTS transporter subunit IIBC [Deltaproteobacteria bacterium]